MNDMHRTGHFGGPFWVPLLWCRPFRCWDFSAVRHFDAGHKGDGRYI